jgi:hypothetical protein
VRARSLFHLAAGTTLVLAACSPRLSPPEGAAGAAAPPVAVERFLQFAADRNYSGMGWVFGTTDGPIIRRDPVSEVEERMFALASVLEHDGFIVGPGEPVPGRPQEALRFNVLVQRGPDSVMVPFTTVRGPDGRWFVEQIAIEAVTGR